MIIGLGTLVLLWGGLFTVIWGVGILVSRAGGLSDEEAGTFSSTFWMGFAGVLGFLQLWHFVAPVGLRSFFVVGLVGAGGVLLARSSHRPHSRIHDTAGQYSLTPGTREDSIPCRSRANCAWNGRDPA